MINFSNTNFVKSASKKSERPAEPYLKEVLMVGKSNVGKSSLINALTNKKNMAFTSSKPGHTRLLNYYNIDNKLYLVDAPGYGYSKIGADLDELFGNMMEDYLNENDRLSLILCLIDSRREVSEDDEGLINFIREKNYPFLIVATKMDKLNQKEKAALMKRMNSLMIDPNQIVLSSSLDKTNIDILRRKIENILFN